MGVRASAPALPPSPPDLLCVWRIAARRLVHSYTYCAHCRALGHYGT